MLRVRTDGSVIRDSCPYRYKLVVRPSSIGNMKEMLTVILVIPDPRRTVVPETRQNGLAIERESSKERADVSVMRSMRPQFGHLSEVDRIPHTNRLVF
jgi:hypothetical protein